MAMGVVKTRRSSSQQGTSSSPSWATASRHSGPRCTVPNFPPVAALAVEPLRETDCTAQEKLRDTMEAITGPSRTVTPSSTASKKRYDKTRPIPTATIGGRSASSPCGTENPADLTPHDEPLTKYPYRCRHTRHRGGTGYRGLHRLSVRLGAPSYGTLKGFGTRVPAAECACSACPTGWRYGRRLRWCARRAPRFWKLNTVRRGGQLPDVAHHR